MKRNMLIAACLHMAIAIALGAFGAHGLKPLLSTDHAESFQTASKYQIYHALALLIIFGGGFFDQLKGLKIVGWLMNLGIILFCGSIYLLSTREVSHLDSISFLGPITPFGGLCFLSAWILLLIKLFQHSKAQ